MPVHHCLKGKVFWGQGGEWHLIVSLKTRAGQGALLTGHGLSYLLSLKNVPSKVSLYPNILSKDSCNHVLHPLLSRPFHLASFPAVVHVSSSLPCQHVSDVELPVHCLFHSEHGKHPGVGVGGLGFILTRPLSPGGLPREGSGCQHCPLASSSEGGSLCMFQLSR